LGHFFILEEIRAEKGGDHRNWQKKKQHRKMDRKMDSKNRLSANKLLVCEIVQ